MNCSKMNIESEVGDLLRSQDLWLATAESCTGGALSSLITTVPGSSDYYRGGVIAYHNLIKKEVLNVSTKDLRRYGAVSEEVAHSMANGILHRVPADVGLSTTGIAGPGGGTPSKPVGLVYIGLATQQGNSEVVRRNWDGSRRENQLDTVREGLLLLKEYLQ